MENNNKRNKIVTLTVIGIIVLLIVLVGATYAYFSAKNKTDPQTINTAKVDLEVKIEPEATNIKNIKPTTWSTDNMETNKANKDIIQIPIKVINHSTISVKYFLRLSSNDLALSTQNDANNIPLQGGKLEDIKYILYSVSTKEDVKTETKVTEGDFRTPAEQQTIVLRKDIGPNDEEQDYILYVYIEETEGEQNKLQGIEFNIQINADTKAPADKTLAETIIKNESEIKHNPNFTENSEDIGLYELEEDSAVAITSEEKGKTYYYRGAVENNYVEFGTYTNDVHNLVYDSDSNKAVDTVVAEAGNPILWRIVRINEDRSIKLIEEHNIGASDQIWMEEWYSMNYNDSDIKLTVDTWYDETFKNPTNEQYQSNKKLDNLVLETEFCNDKQGFPSPPSQSYKYSAAYYRLKLPEPTLKCQQEDIVKAKAGLITADEIVYAGAVMFKTTSNNISYLDNRTAFWTMTPFDNQQSPFYWSRSCNCLHHARNEDLMSTRPVITISAGAPFTVEKNSEYPAGSKQNPYKITIE